MGYRSIVITDEVKKLSTKYEQLEIIKENDRYTIPLEDLNFILIDNRNLLITTPLLTKLSEYNIELFITDQKHLPIGIYIPYVSYFEPLKILQLQISQSDKLKNYLWKMIIKSKIQNQAKVLSILLERDFNWRALLDQVKIGDSSNVEAIASKRYFRELLGSQFSRRNNSEINAWLNYGYAIVRSLIAKEIAVKGLLGCWGVHHKNQFNKFNLADDFIEPFRPIVDLFVLLNFEGELTSLSKHKLVNILHLDCKVNNKKYAVLNAVRLLLDSYIDVLQTSNYKLIKLPQVLNISYHKYE